MLAGIVAGGAFLVSFVLGLFGRTPLVTVFLRALAFSGCFFGIIAGIYFLYNKFLLPSEPDNEEPEYTGRAGNNVDYTLGDDESWLNGLDDGVNGMPEGPSEVSEGGEELIRDVRVSTEADRSNGFAGEPKSPFSGETTEVLAQSDDNGYSVDGDSLLPRKNTGDFSEDGYDMNMSAFLPGIPGIEDDIHHRGTMALNLPDQAADERTVDMSVERRHGKPDLGFDVDGKKMAGAIQTLLKKDLG
jgi:hypothetical protein